MSARCDEAFVFLRPDTVFLETPRFDAHVHSGTDFIPVSIVNFTGLLLTSDPRPCKWHCCAPKPHKSCAYNPASNFR